MNEATRSDLIGALANEFGMTGRPKSEDSHYDRSTNTLFVGSKVYHYEDMEAAKAFMSDNKARMRDKGDNACTYFEIGELAIQMMLEESLGAGGRVVVKDP